jgi:hypothetical protein
MSFSFNHTINLGINIHACVLINQYSTGLFVSYSSHGKTQLYKNNIFILQPLVILKLINSTAFRSAKA